VRKLCLAIIFLVLCTSCVYMKMEPPPDVDKAFLNNNNSCYLATASNMLAGAGYGNGATVQARADDIYGNLTANFGTANSGWADTALSWWLSSANNVWPANPYTVVTVYGNKFPKNPWADSNGARFIGNQLRECNFVGLSISWPTDAPGVIGSGGHAITGWGDNSGDGTLTSNPPNVRLTDSDTDTGGNVQNYTYDAYTSPNPGGPNEGNGWYFNYDANHPYIKHIVTLSPALHPSGNKLAQKVVGSYKIHQDQEVSATDLHYEVGTDVDILSYKTKIDWVIVNAPVITEGTPRRQLTVDWNLSDKPVPYCKWVTITTEFILPAWNAIKYSNVHFTYPKTVKLKRLPAIAWEMKSPLIDKASAIPNVTGGYVVGSFDIVDPNLPSDRRIVAEYRFIHEYSFNQSPEDHTFILKGEKGYHLTNVRFGHSYEYLDAASLWKFDNWMTEMKDEKYALEDKPIEIRINWQGRLPYPEGEDIKGRIPEIKKVPKQDIK
jgi:hypothetical protein